MIFEKREVVLYMFNGKFDNVFEKEEKFKFIIWYESPSYLCFLFFLSLKKVSLLINKKTLNEIMSFQLFH